MKGIILAGGSGTRLSPITKITSKQLIHIYDKPMIYYPLSLLLQSGINEIAIIAAPKYVPEFKRLLGTGKVFGAKFEYFKQVKPIGIADAFNVTRKFIGKSSVTLVLGDNLFFNFDSKLLTKGIIDGANIFCKKVKNPERYGVIKFDDKNKVLEVIEKPKSPPSEYAVTGLYQFGPDVVDKVKQLKPSKRGELEITDLNNMYLQESRLSNTLLKEKVDWFDTGTFSSLFEASQYVRNLQENKKIPVGFPELACIDGKLKEKKDMLKILLEDSSLYAEYLINHIS